MNPEEKKEYQEVRERIVRIICSNWKFGLKCESCSSNEYSSVCAGEIDKANQILSDPSIFIKAVDQEMEPHLPLNTINLEKALRNSGWIKILPKENNRG
jgi:hypothetical protein